MTYQGVPSGLYGFLLFKRNTAGIAMGTLADPNDVDTSGGAVTTHAQWLDIPLSIGAPSVTRTKQTAFYGQQFRGKFDLGAEDIADVPISVGVFSAILNALLTGVSVNSTAWSGARLGGEDLLATTLSDIGIVVEQGFQRLNNGAFVAEKMHNYYAGQISQNAAGADQAGGANPTAAQFQHSFSPSAFSRIYDGRAIAALHPNDANPNRVRYPIQLGYSLGITTVVWDGTAKTFTTNYKPLFDDETATGRNQYVLYDPSTGVATATAVESVNTSSGLVTAVASEDPAPTAGNIGVFTYPTRRIAVS